MTQLTSEKVYLDNSSTTVVCNESVEKIIEMMKDKYGNPSSLHTMGLDAEDEVDYARKVLAKKINCLEQEIIFTSGGTESNNLAIIGAARSKRRLGNKIVTTSIEHSSVIQSCNFLRQQGFDVEFIDPSPDGSVSEEKLFNAVTKDTILISMMMVNNEVGSIFPVHTLKRAVKLKKSPALLHVDAVQAFCKVPVNVKNLKVDLMSMSAHKIHGPKGIGALYVSKDVHIDPIMFGGEQQNKIRPGTEASELIAGFAKAVELEPSYDYVLGLRNYCVDRLLKFENVVLNSSGQALPYILNFSFMGIKSETLLHYLASKNIFVSSGSACAKGRKSYVLEKLGLPLERVDSAIRLSFSRYNTEKDIDLLIDALSQAGTELVRRRK